MTTAANSENESGSQSKRQPTNGQLHKFYQELFVTDLKKELEESNLLAEKGRKTILQLEEDNKMKSRENEDLKKKLGSY